MPVKGWVDSVGTLGRWRVGVLVLGLLVTSGCRAPVTSELGETPPPAPLPVPAAAVGEGEPAAETELLLARGEEPSDELVRKTLREGDSPRLRIMLIERIELRQQAEFLPDLVDLLADENRDVRESAALAVRSFGWERMSPPMLRILSDRDAPLYARELVCRTLVKTGRREVVEPLLALLDEEPLRPTATRGLKDLTSQDIDSAEEWRKWWRVNRDRPKSEWGGPGTKELLERIGRLERELADSRERNQQLEERAADAIVLALENRPQKEAPAPLIAALDEPFARVRRFAASELGKLKAKEAQKKLLELVAADESPAVRVACAGALGQIGAEESIPVLAGLLDDSNADVAAAAARALGRLKAASVANRLLLASLSDSPTVRAAAAESLGQIGHRPAVPRLIELLANDPASSVRERAARALGEIGEKAATPTLERALADESPAVRVYVIEALGALGATQIATKLCAVLTTDENSSVREAAAVTLGKLGGRESLPTLIRILDHPQEKLAQLGSSSIIAICKRDETLCAPAAQALVEAGHHAQAVMLYEVMVRGLTEAKDEQQLRAVQVKLADSLLALEQWTKAAAVLEELTRARPDEVGLSVKYARALTALGKHAEAFAVWRDLARRQPDSSFWDERLALLDAMLRQGKTTEVTELIDEALKEGNKLPEDVGTRLKVLRKRSVEAPPANTEE